MKKKLFLIAACVLLTLLMTACTKKEVMTPAPTVPQATNSAGDGANAPAATASLQPTSPAATAAPSGTDGAQ